MQILQENSNKLSFNNQKDGKIIEGSLKFNENSEGFNNSSINFINNLSKNLLNSDFY